MDDSFLCADDAAKISAQAELESESAFRSAQLAKVETAAETLASELAAISDPGTRFLQCVSALYLRREFDKPAEGLAPIGRLHQPHGQPLASLFASSERSSSRIVAACGAGRSDLVRELIRRGLEPLAMSVGDIPELGVYPNSADLDSWHFDAAALMRWVAARTSVQDRHVAVVGYKHTVRSSKKVRQAKTRGWIVGTGTESDSGYRLVTSWEYADYALLDGTIGRSTKPNARKLEVSNTRSMSTKDLPTVATLVGIDG